MSAGFTPGPWSTETSHTAHPKFGIFSDGGRVILARTWTANDARLIAAAPALYEALLRVMDAYGFDPSIDSSIWNEAGAALKQARGDLVDPLEQVKL